MTRASILLGMGAGLLVGLIASACTSDGSGGVTPGACDQIIDACHTKDDGSDDFINGCHSTAHEGDDAACSSNLQACLDACNAAPPVGTGGHESGETGHDHETGAATSHDHGSSGGHDSSGGATSHDHGSTGGSTGADDASQASCDELGSICHDVADALGMMCHDVGHEGDEAACAEIWVECVAHCTA